MTKVSKSGIISKSFTCIYGRKDTYNGQAIYYDKYGNIISYSQNTVEYNNRNLLSCYKKGSGEKLESYYNHQGIRYKKVCTKTNGEVLKKIFYLDGNKIIGESWSDGRYLTYFYDAEGVAGLRCEGVDSYKGEHFNFNFVRDGLGNITKIMHRNKLVAEYIYDAWASFVCVYCKKYNKKQSQIYNNF